MLERGSSLPIHPRLDSIEVAIREKLKFELAGSHTVRVRRRRIEECHHIWMIEDKFLVGAAGLEIGIYAPNCTELVTFDIYCHVSILSIS
ncbi:MAG: hypothetical protein ABS58_13515 [Mesorhizobium sp. SCN 65-20]|nr:MAG: hypothetical protein ABS58_13515 [Mesorhizobium sp. SCN 65-20]